MFTTNSDVTDGTCQMECFTNPWDFLFLTCLSGEKTRGNIQKAAAPSKRKQKPEGIGQTLCLPKTKQTGQIFSLPMKPNASYWFWGMTFDACRPTLSRNELQRLAQLLPKSIRRTEKPLMPLCSPIMTKFPVLIKQLLLQHQYCSSHGWQACKIRRNLPVNTFRSDDSFAVVVQKSLVIVHALTSLPSPCH